MINIFNYKLSINLDPYLLVFFFIVAAIYAAYIYKNTIPQTSKFLRVVFISIRSLVLAIILFLIFEPTLTVLNTDEYKPVVPVFIDNSASMSNNDSLVSNEIINTIKGIQSNENIDFQYFFFGDELKRINKDSIQFLGYREGITNFENIFERLRESEDYITGAVIISDGIINDGSSSIYEAEELNFPVYTIGIGDTTKVTDLFISSILNNRFIYKETPTLIAAEISNENLANRIVNVSLLENNNLLESREVELNESGINRVVFEYTPEKEGKQKITVQASQLENEQNINNNIRSKFIDVLENKLNILILAGSPSMDFSVVYNSLKSVDEFNTNKIIQINDNKFSSENLNAKLDSAQVLVLINFPFQNTADGIIKIVKDKITGSSLPVLNFMGADLQSLNLNSIADLLPFTQSRTMNEVFLAQPQFSESNFNLIDGGNTVSNPASLPPITYPNGGFKVKPGTKVIATAQVNNIATDFPMIISRDETNNKCITFIGSNFWRWKINSDEENTKLFQQLIFNSIQWLRVSDNQQKFFVKVSKDIYSAGEKVEFIGELYDEKLEPVDNASISVEVNSGNKSERLKLESKGNGIYQGSIYLSSKGDYSYSAQAEINGVETNRSSGKFNIGEVDLEKLQTVMQDNYLKMIASLTGGSYTYISDSRDQFNKIETLNRNNIRKVTSTITYDPTSLEVFLIILILLLSIEWFLRKKEGML